MPIDYDAARSLLEEVFAEIESEMLQDQGPACAEEIRQAVDIIFDSSTQAYREVLVGSVLARIQDTHINIRLHYAGQEENAYNGRTLDERVVNPFLHDHRIPSSRGPFLSVFRRSVRFDASTRSGLRDRRGYDALLECLSFLEDSEDENRPRDFLRCLLSRFVTLREGSAVALSRLQRISLDQYGQFISELLETPSGGRLPVLLVVSTFTAIKEFFGLDWNIVLQGINVADSASGSGGDITIEKAGEILMAAEITERPVDRSRVVATFNTKIAPHGIEDYLFFTRLQGVSLEARTQTHQYFSQGHEVNFLEIKDWILMCLATMGSQGRSTFNRVLVGFLDSSEVPRSIKVAWNRLIARLTSLP